MNSARRRLLRFATASAAGAVVVSRPASARSVTSPSQSAAEMHQFLAARGLSALHLSVPQLVENALEFYRRVRVSGLAKTQHADMLLFQWGVYNWGRGESFEFDITRQYIGAGFVGDDAISQLRCTAYFQPTPELRALRASNRWCESMAEIDSFSRFIHESAAFRAVKAITPARVNIEWSQV